MAESRPLQPVWPRPAKSRGVGLAGQLAVGGATLLAVLGILHQTVSDTVWTWETSNAFNHGFLIVPMALFLAWTRRSALAATVPKPDFRGALLVLLAALAWLMGYITGTRVVQELSLVAVLQATVLTVYGGAVLRVLLFPLLYLYLAVPMGEALIPPLERVTAYFSVELLRLVGVPVFSDGNLISVPNGNFYVAEACAGLRYLISSLALGVFFAGLAFRSWWRRAVFLAVSLVVPVIANGIRAFGIILIAYLSDNQLAVGVDHLIYGWLFFALVSLLVLLFGAAIREPHAEPEGPRPGAAAGRSSLATLVMAAALALLPVAGAKAYGDYLERPPEGPAMTAAVPAAVGAYHLLPGTGEPQPPEFSSPDSVAAGAYQAEGPAIVYLHIGYYARERIGAEAASSAHRLAGGDWLVAANAMTTARIGTAESAVEVQQLASGQRRRLVWYWYWVDGRFTGNPYLAKLLQAKVKLLGGEPAAAVIALSTDYGETPADAERSLRAFAAGLDALAPALRGAG